VDQAAPISDSQWSVGRGSRRTDRLPGPSVRAIFATKGAAMFAILVLMWLTRWLVYPAVPADRYSIIILLALLPTVVVLSWRRAEPVLLLSLSLGADTVAVTAGIHFGGGVDNVSGPLLYAIVIALAGLILSTTAAYATALWAGLLYGLVVWAEARQWLDHQVPYSKPPEDAAATVIVVSAYLLLVAWVISYAVRQIRAIYERAEAMRSDAVRALSHDLKNPLTVIQGYAEITEEATQAERRSYLRGIRHAARQALDLVHNVLDAAAVTGRPIIPRHEQVALNDLVRETVEQYQATADGKGVHLTTVLADQAPIVEGDVQMLSRSIGNLVSNAIKFTAREGSVQTATTVVDDKVLITVRDSGCGIAEADLPILFQPYSRGGSGLGVEGTGLGLYIVRQIAEAHGGAVRVVSVVGSGSTFTLELPLHSSDRSV
jgi:signal transduction histidine kinase